MDEESRNEKPEEEAQEQEDAYRLANPALRSLERGPIRMRESGVTHAGWRMEIDSDEGIGAITLIEFSGPGSAYRGEGVCLGWGQEQMSTLYHSLRAVPDEPDMVFNQLG